MAPLKRVLCAWCICFPVPRYGVSTSMRPFLEPWLSSCRAVEAPSRRCRGAVESTVEALSRPCLSSLSSSCRVAVEAVEADCMCLGVELSSSCRVSLSRLSSLYTLSSVLSSSSLACSIAILHEAL